jgi:hypothetical protein
LYIKINILKNINNLNMKTPKENTKFGPQMISWGKLVVTPVAHAQRVTQAFRKHPSRR